MSNDFYTIRKKSENDRQEIEHMKNNETEVQLIKKDTTQSKQLLSRSLKIQRPYQKFTILKI